MGLMDKFKNLFTDEEYEEEEIEEPVKIKEIKKEKKEENKLPTFMREKIEKEEKEPQQKSLRQEASNISDFSINKDIINDSIMDSVNMNENASNESHNVENNVQQPAEQNKKFKFPIAFEDSDFTDISRVSRQARNKKVPSKLEREHEVSPAKPKQVTKPLKKEPKVSELYKEKKPKKEKEEKKFKATPIISPIYGVLDKNYKKEELEPNSGDNYELQRPSKNVDFDSVRKKAYGSLVEDIKNNMMCQNCEYLKKAKACKKEISEDNLMYEALCERNTETFEEDIKEIPEREVKDVTLDEATENYFDYGVEYEKATPPKDEVSDNVKILNHDYQDVSTPPKKNNTIPPVKSSINLLSTLKKSMGDEETNSSSTDGDTNKKNLELTDDLFNLIDSMYDEGKDDK